MNIRAISLFLLCTGLLGGIIIIQRLQTLSDGNTIAILQTASHPALDAVRDSFVREIKKINSPINLVIHNGEGSIDQLHLMAKKVAHDPHIDAIVAIATPSAQAVAQIEDKKPIIFAAVTDAKNARLEQPNVTGCLDTIDCRQQLELMKALVPKTKTLGIIFNIGEINAATLAQQMKEICIQEGITCVKLGFAHETDIVSLLDQRLEECDILWAPLDNSVASSISLISHKTLQAKKPFFVSDNLLVRQGALAAAGVDYTTIGQQTAKIVSSILFNEKKPSEIPFNKPTIEKFWINKHTLQQLGLSEKVSLDADSIEWAEK